MRLYKRALRAWDHFLFSPLDPFPVACMRIGVGLLLTVSLLANSPNWHRNMALDGMSGPWDFSQWFSIFTWTHGKVSVELWGWVAVALAIAYTMGRRPKVCAAALLVILTSMFRRNWCASNAEDTMFRMYMFYSLFLPVGDLLSWDRSHSPRPSATKALADAKVVVASAAGSRRLETYWCWPVRMVQIHLALIYLISTPTKWMSDVVWRNGDAMYYIMINPMWSRWPWPWMFYAGWVTQLTTWGSLLVEGSFPFFVWIPKFRKYIACEMIIFHLLLAIMLQNITFFSLSMIPGLFLFLKEDEIRGFIAWAERRSTDAYKLVQVSRRAVK